MASAEVQVVILALLGALGEVLEPVRSEDMPVPGWRSRPKMSRLRTSGRRRPGARPRFCAAHFSKGGSGNRRAAPLAALKDARPEPSIGGSRPDYAAQLD